MTPTRRWFLRTCFLLPLLLCILGWLWSGSHHGRLRCQFLNSRLELATAQGIVSLEWYHDGKYTPGWLLWTNPLDPPSYWFSDDQAPGSSFLGFICHSDHPTYPGAPAYQFELQIPYWSLLLFFGLAFFFIYRKTRPRTSPVNAFPVEVKK